MSVVARLLLVLVGFALLAIQVGLVLQHAWATPLLPWPETGPGYLLAGATVAAVALPLVWVGLCGELAAIRGGAVAIAVAAGAAAVFLYAYFDGLGADPFNRYTFFAAGLFIVNLLLYGIVAGLPYRDELSTPSLVRWSILLLSFALLAAALALMWQLAVVLPWPLKPESGVLAGCVALGAAAYLLHAFAIPSWGNTTGVLLALLAFGFVLLWPLGRQLAGVNAMDHPILLIWVIVLVYSTLLALLYLVFHPRTRLARLA